MFVTDLSPNPPLVGQDRHIPALTEHALPLNTSPTEHALPLNTASLSKSLPTAGEGGTFNSQDVC